MNSIGQKTAFFIHELSLWFAPCLSLRVKTFAISKTFSCLAYISFLNSAINFIGFDTQSKLIVEPTSQHKVHMAKQLKAMFRK